MPEKVKTIRNSGFRLFNIGGRAQKKRIAVIILASIIAVTGTMFIVIGTHSIKGEAYQHLMAQNVEIGEIKEVIVKYSFKNNLLFSNNWTIAVEYYDEPEVYYMYSYQDKKIAFSGIAGGDVIQEKSAYKHSEDTR